MKWLWEHKDWPHFTYDKSVFAGFEKEFHQNTGVILGSLKAVSLRDQEELRVSILSDEAMETSRIEGELLDRDSVQSSVRKHLGLQTDGRRVKPQETGISQMLVDLFKNYNAPLSHETLFKWHSMTLNGRTDIEVIGGYRNHSDPMQIVSGRLDNPKVFYEAPPSSKVKEEMDRYISWYNSSLHVDKSSVVHAGIAHLYFELIHPFEDGNGRIGRCVAEKSLAMTSGQPLITALSRVLESDKNNYYRALEQANASLDVTSWLIFFAEKIIESQRYSQQLVDFILAKTRFYETFSSKLNTRQQKVVQRIFREGVLGFKGGLSAKNYIRITQTSRATATRDLQELVAMGAMKKEGELRHTRYYLLLD